MSEKETIMIEIKIPKNANSQLYEFFLSSDPRWKSLIQEWLYENGLTVESMSVKLRGISELSETGRYLMEKG